MLAHEVLGGRDLLFLVAPRAAGGKDELSEAEGRCGGEETAAVVFHEVLPILAPCPIIGDVVAGRMMAADVSRLEAAFPCSR